MEDPVIIHRRGDIIGLLFQFLNGIAHGDADASLKNHRGVVASITKGDGLSGVKALMTCHREDALALVSPIGCDVCKLRMPSPRHALWHTSQQVHVDSEDKTSYLIQVSGSNYKANTLFVNESGLYVLFLFTQGNFSLSIYQDTTSYPKKK